MSKAVSISQVRDMRSTDPQHGFSSFGAFASAVRSARTTKQVDERLLIGAAAPGTFGSEGVGQEGGFAAPPAYSREVQTIWAAREDNLLNFCDTVQVDSNSMVLPVDQGTPWGTGGVRAYWQAEGGVTTPTKPALGTLELRLSKLVGIVPVSDELLRDAPALNSYLPAKLALSIMYKVNDSILNGLGNGQPKGCFAPPGAAVVVAKDGSQAASTVSTTNLTNMIARLPAGSFGNAIWLVSPDATGAFIGASPAGYPTVPGPTKANGQPSNLIGLVLGRPALSSPHVPAFSAQGDISLVDLSFYQVITRSIGPQTVLSFDFAFDADCGYFKTVLRIDGVSKLPAAIAQARGTASLSPFVQLAAR